MSKYHPSSSRPSSSGSVQAMSVASCEGGISDEDDSDGARGVGGHGSNAMSYKERRREAHTQAEQKRRDAIKKGYDYLQDLVPTCSSSNQPGSANGTAAAVAEDGPGGASAKISKALVLQKSIEYIQFVQQQKKKQEDELVLLKKEVFALEIMRRNYEQLVKSHTARSSAAAIAAAGSDRSSHDDSYVPVEVKFQVFQLLMDSLFNSFNDNVGMNNFSELSGCVFSWLEEQCKPQLLQELMLNILQQVKTDYIKEQQGEEEGQQGMSSASLNHQSSQMQ